MIDELEAAMKALILKINATKVSTEAMQYSQAVLNTAHAIATIGNLDR